MTKCYVCHDSGWVSYHKKFNDLKYRAEPVDYEYWGKCICGAGEKIGKKIPSIDMIIPLEELRKMHVKNKKGEC